MGAHPAVRDEYFRWRYHRRCGAGKKAVGKIGSVVGIRRRSTRRCCEDCAGRGVLATRESFGRYRIIFDMRHVSGSPDHQACVLVFCTAPTAGEKPLDALGGIQFQGPSGGSWDYRKGHNNGGKGEFNRLIKPTFNIHAWSRVEILVDPATGSGRMAVAQPPGSKAIEVLDFKDESAGQKGPFALQMHNRGLFDEYTNIAIEEDPKSDDLITTKE